MSNVWVIEDGEYSDYTVVGVFSTQENAELVVKAISTGTVACWPLDPAVEELRQGLTRYHIFMLRDGTTEFAEQSELSRYSLRNEFWIWQRTKAPAYRGKGIPDCLWAKVWAKDLQGAVKAANEHRAMMIANGEWQ